MCLATKIPSPPKVDPLPPLPEPVKQPQVAPTPPAPERTATGLGVTPRSTGQTTSSTSGSSRRNGISSLRINLNKNNQRNTDPLNLGQ